jgi:hypothetical protein
MSLTLPLSSELELRLNREAGRLGIEPPELACRLLEQHLPSPDRRQKLVGLIQSWIDEDHGEQKETGDYLIQVLDKDRAGQRKLFSPEMEGVSW